MKLSHVLGLLENKKVRSDAFRTKLVRIIMKIPLFICQSKNPPVIRTTLYKSKDINEYRRAFRRAFNILKQSLNLSAQCQPYVNKINFIDFCSLHFPTAKVIELGGSMGKEEEARAQEMCDLRAKTSLESYKKYHTLNTVFKPLILFT